MIHHSGDFTDMRYRLIAALPSFGHYAENICGLRPVNHCHVVLVVICFSRFIRYPDVRAYTGGYLCCVLLVQQKLQHFLRSLFTDALPVYDPFQKDSAVFYCSGVVASEA